MSRCLVIIVILAIKLSLNLNKLSSFDQWNHAQMTEYFCVSNWHYTNKIISLISNWFGQKIALVYCQRCNIWFKKQVSIILFCFIWVSKNLCTDFTDLSWHQHIWPSVKLKLVLPSPPLFCYNWQHNTFSCSGPLEPGGKGGNPYASTPLRFWKQYKQNFHLQKTIEYYMPPSTPGPAFLWSPLRFLDLPMALSCDDFEKT